MSEPGDRACRLMPPIDTPWDGIVIGAGPAGAMAARQLALAGRRVLLVEKKRFPRWKICGACLNGQALAALRSAGLGSLVTRLGAIATGRVPRRFPGPDGTRWPCPKASSLSRSRLDAALVEAATAAGVEFLEETHAAVGDVRDGTRRVTAHPSRTVHRGRGPRRAGRHGPGQSATGGRLGGTNAEFGPARGSAPVAWSPMHPRFYDERTIFMAVGRDGYVGAVRVEDGSLNVAAAFEPALVRRSGDAGIGRRGGPCRGRVPGDRRSRECSLAGDGRPHAADASAGRGAALSAG